MDERQINQLFSAECDFVAGAASEESIPDSDLNEVAFAGRSNVGKSSLLNALTHRRKLARVSSTPGCTQQLNFFNLGSRLMLVDLPGYGYAKASKKEVKGWGKIAVNYLSGRVQLKRVFILIDSRRGLKDTDEEILKILDEAAVPHQIILTKCDKAGKAELKKILDAVNESIYKHPAAINSVLTTSSHDGIGIEELRREIFSVINS